MIQLNKPVEAWEKMKWAQKVQFVPPGAAEEFLLHAEKQLMPISGNNIALALCEGFSYEYCKFEI